MTKKSSNPPTQDMGRELLGMHREAQTLVHNAATLGTLLKNAKLCAHLPDATLTTQRMMAMSKDLQVLHSDLKDLDNQVTKLQTTQVTTDNIMDLMAIGDRYHRWFDRYTGTVVPNLTAISNDIQKATEQLEKNKEH